MNGKGEGTPQSISKALTNIHYFLILLGEGEGVIFIHIIFAVSATWCRIVWNKR